MKLCKSCNYENPDGLDFCDQCNAPLFGTEDSGNENEFNKFGIGQVIGLRYIITADARDYSFGDVFDAEDAVDDSAVSLSILPNDISADESVVRKLKKASEQVLGLSHENQIDLLDMELDDERKFLVHQKSDGSPLSEKIASSPLSVEECLLVFTKIGEALDFVHSRGIIHGDIEPANILLEEKSGASLLFPVVSEIIKNALPDKNKESEIYKAFEQVEGSKIRRSDIYSFAACIYISLGGSLEGGRFVPLGILSDNQNRALRNGLDSKPICRQGTCGELLKDLGVDVTKLQWKAAQLFSISISGGEHGRVFLPTQPNARFDPGTEIQIKAVPDDHYHFVNWTGSAVRAGNVEDENSSATKLLVDADYTLIANFQIDQHELVVSSSQGGSVLNPSGSGEKYEIRYEHGKQIELNAEPQQGQHFVGWTGSAVDNGYVAEPDKPNTIITIEDDCDLHAEFAVDKFVLTVNCSEGGIVQTDGQDVTEEFPFSGEYVSGSEIIITAEAKENYTFAGWAGSAVETGKIEDPGDPEVTLTMDDQYTLEAVFTVNSHELNLTVSGSGKISQPAESLQRFDHGSEINLKADPQGHNHFAGWTGSAVDAGKVADPSNPVTTLKVDGDYSLEAVFEVDRFTLEIPSTEGGVISVETQPDSQIGYEFGTKVNISAKADENYHFVEWSGTAVEARKIAAPFSKQTTVTIEDDYTLYAVFELDRHMLNLSAVGGGSVSEPAQGYCEYEHGQQVVIKASAEDNHHFVEWSISQADEDKVADIYSAETTVVIDEDISLEAVFEKDKHRLDLISSGNGSAGTVDNFLDNYIHGRQVAIEAIASANHHFVEWVGPAVVKGWVEDPKSAKTTVAVNGDIEVEAVFAIDQKTLTVNCDQGGLITLPGNGKNTYTYGQEVIIECYPDEHYQFAGWTGSAVENKKVADPSSTKTTVRLQDDYEVNAVFVKDTLWLRGFETIKSLLKDPTGRSVVIFIAAVLFILFIAAVTGSSNNSEMLSGFWEDAQKEAQEGNFASALVIAGRIQGLSEDFAEDENITETKAKWQKELEAQKAWGEIELMVIRSKYDVAAVMANRLIRQYPNTKAAAKAKKEVEKFNEIIKLNNRLSNAAELDQSGEHKQALEEVSSILKDHPDNSRARLLEMQIEKKINADKRKEHLKFAVSAEKNGEWDKAIDHYVDVLELSPNDEKIKDMISEAYVAKASAIENKKDFDSAIEAMISYKLALSVKSSDTVQKKLDSAKKDLEAYSSEKINERIRNKLSSMAAEATKNDRFEAAAVIYKQLRADYPGIEGIDDKLHDLFLSMAKRLKEGGNLRASLIYFREALVYKQADSTQKEMDSVVNTIKETETRTNKQMKISNFMKDAEDAKSKGNLSAAFSAYKKAADEGSPKAMVAAGNSLYNGLGVKEDSVKAVEWFRKAADLNFPGVYSHLGLAYAEGKGKQRNLPAAIELFKKGAALGCGRCMYYLSKAHHNGEGVERDMNKAKEWLDKSAETGDVWAMHNLAMLHHKGRGVGKDMEKALTWYEKAANGGDIDAMYNLGVVYVKGDGVEKNETKGMCWLTRAAENGHSAARFHLGVAYFDGIGVLTNYPAARKWLTMSAENGNAAAADRLGDIYIEGLGIAKAPKKAIEYYTSAAKAGNLDSMHKLGVIYHDGKVVQQDYKKAFEYFSLAADGGNTESMYYVSKFLNDGLGVDQNKVMAIEWLTSAAEEGHVKAIYELASALNDGEFVPQDLKAAFQWFKKAAKADCAEANFKVALMYQEGAGVEKDEYEAVKWHQKAARLGHNKAKERLLELNEIW